VSKNQRKKEKRRSKFQQWAKPSALPIVTGHAHIPGRTLFFIKQSDK
jgi:hypothetical protein